MHLAPSFQNLASSTFFAVLLTTCCFASTVRANDPLTDLFDAAREHNPDILAAHARWRAAQARRPQARALPDPKIAFEAMGRTADATNTTAMLEQAFPWPGTRGRRGAVASLDAHALWHAIEAVELKTLARIRVIAAEIAYLQKETGLIRENLELFRKQEDFLEQTARGGGDVSDLVRIEMESGLLDDDLAQIGERVRRQTADLEALVDGPVSAARVARIRLPEPSPGATDRTVLMARLETDNPMLQVLARRVEAARAGVDVARLETYPEFMLGAGYRREAESGMESNRGSMDEAVILFSASLPVWREKNRGSRDEAAALLDTAIQERESAARMLRAQLETFLSYHRDAGRRAELFQKQLLPKARQARETVEASYRGGSAGLLDVFDSRRRLLETETGYWRALADIHINQAEIDALFGTAVEPTQPDR